MGKHHHGGGYRGGWGPGWGYPVQYPAAEVFVVDDSSSDKLARVMAFVMTLPKGQRRAAFEKLTGRAAPAALGGCPTGAVCAPMTRSNDISIPMWVDPVRPRPPWYPGPKKAMGDAYAHAQSRAADNIALGYLPVPGAPESLGCSCTSGMGCASCGGKCGGMGSVVDDIKAMSMPAKIAVAVGVVLLAKHFAKKRR